MYNLCSGCSRFPDGCGNCNYNNRLSKSSMHLNDYDLYSDMIDAGYDPFCPGEYAESIYDYTDNF